MPQKCLEMKRTFATVTTDQCFFSLTSKNYSYKSMWRDKHVTRKWTKIVNRQFTEVWKANKYWEKKMSRLHKLTTLWRDGLALVEGVAWRGKESYGLWPVSWVITKSVLLTLDADLDPGSCENRFLEVYPCRLFPSEALEAEYVSEQPPWPLLLLQNASAQALRAAPRRFSGSSLPPHQHRHLLSSCIPQLLWDKVYCGLRSQLLLSLGKHWHRGFLTCPTTSSCPPLQPLSSAGAPHCAWVMAVHPKESLLIGTKQRDTLQDSDLH